MSEKTEEKNRFIPLTFDPLFKSLWRNSHSSSKKFLYRVFNNILGFDISNYTILPNELVIKRSKSVHNIVDILLESPDKKVIVNIEMNTQYHSNLRNRNESYLYKIAGDFYDSGEEEKYVKKINVYQINLNLFTSRDDKNIGISTYSMKDSENSLDLKSIKIIDIFIPTICETWYNIDTEIQLDYKMFNAKSYEEMEEYAKGNKERMSVMKDIKEQLAKYKRIERKYDAEEYIKSVEIANKKEGREEERKEIIQKLISYGMPKEEISKALGMPIV